MTCARGPLKEGWEEYLPGVRARKRSRPGPCQTCRLRPMCAQCPGWAQLENGDPEQPVEYLCQMAHLRAKTLQVSD